MRVFVSWFPDVRKRRGGEKVDLSNLDSTMDLLEDPFGTCLGGDEVGTASHSSLPALWQDCDGFIPMSKVILYLCKLYSSSPFLLM